MPAGIPILGCRTPSFLSVTIVRHDFPPSTGGLGANASRTGPSCGLGIEAIGTEQGRQARGMWAVAFGAGEVVSSPAGGGAISANSCGRASCGRPIVPSCELVIRPLGEAAYRPAIEPDVFGWMVGIGPTRSVEAAEEGSSLYLFAVEALNPEVATGGQSTLHGHTLTVNRTSYASAIGIENIAFIGTIATQG